MRVTEKQREITNDAQRKERAAARKQKYKDVFAKIRAKAREKAARGVEFKFYGAKKADDKAPGNADPSKARMGASGGAFDDAPAFTQMSGVFGSSAGSSAGGISIPAMNEPEEDYLLQLEAEIHGEGPGQRAAPPALGGQPPQKRVKHNPISEEPMLTVPTLDDDAQFDEYV